MRNIGGGIVYPNVALKRQLNVPPTLYNAGFGHVLWVTCDFTRSEFGNMLENAIAKRLKVPL
ncbi:MAG: hypothetical protein WCO26_01060 [Deltaproteobacteria bacterium]|jgi:hypothetical protein